MKFYLAPMEGITGFVYRNAYHKYFEPFDKYFLPFISPNPRGKLAPWEAADIMPEHNVGMHAVPQILTNRADEFINTANKLKEYGFEEVNLNLGCPSKTVVAKYRGSGFLARTEELECFLTEIFDRLSMKISIKTRIGRWDADEFEELLDIYNKFPLEELIVHPRVQKDFYGNTPDMKTFKRAYEESKCPVCYNGDVFSADDYIEKTKAYSDLEMVMLGRGVLKNPRLLGEIKGVRNSTKDDYRGFHDELLEGYLCTIYGEKNAIFKMKEIWGYLKNSFRFEEKDLLSIRMSDNKEMYEKAVDQFFLHAELL